MGSARNETPSVWLCVSGYCLNSASLMAIITYLQVSYVGHKKFRGVLRLVYERIIINITHYGGY